MVRCLSRPGVHGKLQSHMCRCAGRQTTDVSEDGMTMSGYDAEDTWKIRGVCYSHVGNEVIPSYANASSARHVTHVECLQPSQVFFQQCPGFSTMKAYCQDTGV